MWTPRKSLQNLRSSRRRFLKTSATVASAAATGTFIGGSSRQLAGDESLLRDAIDIRRLPGSTVVDVVRGQGYFPVIATLGDKRLAVVHRGGDGHVGVRGRLDISYSTDLGQTWGQPSTVIDSPLDDRNPAFGVASNGTLLVAYQRRGGYDEEGKEIVDMDRVDTRVICSRDGGRSWVDDSPLSYNRLNGTSPFGKIRPDSDGTLYLPVYSGPFLADLQGFVATDKDYTPAYLLRSYDQGETWTNPILIGLGLSEPEVLFLPNGDWLAAARTGPLVTCRSSDGGKTWGDLQQVTESREHPPDLTLLNDGKILLTFGRRNPPYGVQGLISRDLGHSWESRRLLFADELPGRDIGYPSTVRQDNGRMVTTFYSAGTHEEPHTFHEAVNAFCRAVCYDEAALLAAWDAR